MKIIFLGTNGWYSTEAGDTICTLIETKNYYIVFDAGEGFGKLDRYIKKDRPVFVFLSHLHLDHIYGLHILVKMKFRDRMTIVVPRGKHRDLMEILRAPFTAPLDGKIKIIPARAGRMNDLPFACECFRLKHHDGSFGYKLELENKTISYCSDTAYDHGIIKYIQNCDMLIHECTNKINFKDPGWGHSNPEEAARMGKEAKVGKLVLTHFLPDFYPTLSSRRKAGVVARKIFKETFIAEDDMTIVI